MRERKERGKKQSRGRKTARGKGRLFSEHQYPDFFQTRRVQRRARGHVFAACLSNIAIRCIYIFFFIYRRRLAMYIFLGLAQVQANWVTLCGIFQRMTELLRFLYTLTLPDTAFPAASAWACVRSLPVEHRHTLHRLCALMVESSGLRIDAAAACWGTCDNVDVCTRNCLRFGFRL